MTRPVASCIMPTYNRRRFVPGAVERFLAQDLADLELIVVDDGTDPIGDVLPADPRVRYHRLDRRIVLGAKRNLACSLAAAPIVVHWDDDDWSASWRVGRQLEALELTGADVCGVSTLLFHDAERSEAYRYTYPDDRAARAWVAGTSMAYRREFWERNRFPEIRNGEDTRFLWTAGPKRVHRLDDERMVVARIHSSNTAVKRPSGNRWRRLDAETARQLGQQLDRDAHPSGETVVPRVPKVECSMSPARPAAAEAPAPGRHVVVSIPYFGCGSYLVDTVESILEQTHRDLTLVVTNDADPEPPWDRLAHVDDPRLIRFDLGANRGRYFVDDVVLRAVDGDLFLVQDADDWSEPDRVRALLEELERHSCDAVISDVNVFCERPTADGFSGPHTSRGRIERARPLARPVGPELRYLACHHGLFRRDSLLRLGGYFGGHLIGYDTFVMSLLLMTGRVGVVPRSLYHRRQRDGSLTTAPATGMRSPARREVRRSLSTLHRDLHALHQDRQQLGDDEFFDRLRRRCAREVAPALVAARDADVARLQTLADRRADLPTPPSASAPATPTAARTGVVAPSLDDLVARTLPWGRWTIEPALARRLAAHLANLRPRHILEAGSGVSTLFLARHVAEHGGRFVSLEHHEDFLRRTRELLDRFDLRDHVELIHAPINSFVGRDGVERRWYGVDLQGRFDFAFVDGPPQAIGRDGTMFALAAHRASPFELWLHDAVRDHEQDCLRTWSRRFRFRVAEVDSSGKGLAILKSFSRNGQSAPRRRAVIAPA